MAPQDMANRIVANSERGITTTVNDIEHMESQSVYGLGVIKVFFHPGTNVQGAIAQITAISQTTVRGLPPGTTPPLIISYSASTTPIIQLGLSSKTLPEQELFDLGQNFLRTFLATVPGAATPYPYGGKLRKSRWIWICLSCRRMVFTHGHRQCRECAEHHFAGGHDEARSSGI